MSTPGIYSQCSPPKSASRPGVTVSFSIDNDVKDRIRTAVDIVDLVGSYVQLRRQGANFVGLCPFHEDRRPSFNVNPTRQTWKCWVCDLGGDVFSFLMEKERISFGEALQMLSDRTGIVLPKNAKPGKRQDANATQKKTMYEAMAWAVDTYHQCLLHDDQAQLARSYLLERGINEQSISRFKIGFSPDSWNWLGDLGRKKGIQNDLLESVGLLVKTDRGTHYDRFRGRLLFPINDPQGRPISIGGRILPGASKDQAKYVNCNETRLYHKSRQLYALDIARDSIQKSQTAIVMEGYTDVIMAYQHGVTNAVAVCGTALGEHHIGLLRRYCDTVVLLLDGDEAGQKRTNEILELFIAAQMDLRVATLPDDLDPCDFLIERGGEAMQAVLAKTVDALEHKLSIACRGFDPILDTHRANVALEQVLGLLAKATRENLLNNETVRMRQNQILNRLSRQFGIETVALRDRLESLRKEVAKRIKPTSINTASPASGSSQLSNQTSERTNFGESSGQSVRNPQNPSRFPNDRSSNRPFIVNEQASASTPQSTPKEPRRLSFQEMTPVDRELFEIMVLHAELVPIAIEQFPKDSLTSDTAKRLWQLYVDMEFDGYELDFNSIMSAIEDGAMKNVLVTLEQEATQKSEYLKMNADERLHALCERLARQDQRVKDQQRLKELESKLLQEEEELTLLQQLISDVRQRQGLIPQPLNASKTERSLRIEMDFEMGACRQK